jgi:hypothetical protein
MRGLSQGVELLHFAKDPSDGEWYVCQMACDGTLATTFSVPTPSVYAMLDKLDGEAVLGEYLERQAYSLIERYGDARCPKPDPALLEQLVS